MIEPPFVHNVIRYARDKRQLMFARQISQQLTCVKTSPYIRESFQNMLKKRIFRRTFVFRSILRVSRFSKKKKKYIETTV